MPIDNALAELEQISPGTCIILPGKEYTDYSYPDLLVSGFKRYKTYSWNKTHELLAEENSSMLTPRQFIDFLLLLKSSEKIYDGNGKEASSQMIEYITNEIDKKENRWRGEYLDIKFRKLNNEWLIDYNHRFVDKKLIANNSEKLYNYTLKSKGYVSLFTFTMQGLPQFNTKTNSPQKRNSRSDYSWLYSECETFFLPMTKDSVASFANGPNGPIFGCDWNPIYEKYGFGVRPAKIKD